MIKALKILILTNLGGPDDIDCYTKKEIRQLTEVIASFGYKVFIIDMKKGKLEDNIKKIENIGPNLVFNLCESIYGKAEAEVLIPQLLELLNIDYVGCDPITIALCCDKVRVKEILSFYKIPTANFQVFDSFKQKNMKLRTDLNFPLFVKPGFGGGSVGIDEHSIVFTKKELYEKVNYVVKQMKKPVIVEEFLPGREFTVVILGNNHKNKKPLALPIVELEFDEGFTFKNRFYFYEAKWQDEITDRIKRVSPKLPKRLRKKIEKITVDAYNALNCNDFARIDVRLDKKNKPFVLDINANPGLMCIEMRTAALLKGLNFEELVKMIIDSAIERCKLRKDM